MVFDDIGDHTGIANFFLCGKNTGFILFRIKIRTAVIPSPVALAVNSLRKINILEKYPFSPIKSAISSGFSLKTSPTVNAL